MRFEHGNLLKADTEAIVNTVNCVGVMGKGIALQFKQAYPENMKAYAKACKANRVKPGHMFTYHTERLSNPKYIINFPTKRHWKGRSKLDDVEVGLRDLANEIQHLQIKSIAVPPLGCGHGGLEWETVKPMIESALSNIQGVDVIVYEPKGTPKADLMPITQKNVSMTRARALLIKLLDFYAIPGYKLSLLEIQKLAYFLQVAGEPLQLRYVKHKFGPYADNLNFLLQKMEGVYIRGYGDRSAKALITLLHGASDEADEFLAGDQIGAERLHKVSNLVNGFETPYGMELLASVHWIAFHDKEPIHTIEEAIEKIFTWNARKKQLFKGEHITKAWQRLSDEKWL